MARADVTRPAPAAWLLLAAVCLVSTQISLNVNVLALALPALTEHFDASATAGSWLLLSFVVTNTACLLLFGRMTDVIGQRRLYIIGIAVFASGTFLCGFAPTVESLIGLRIVSAVGAAILLGNGATLLHQAFPSSHLGQAMGLYVGSFSVASLIGPIVGGLIVSLWGWQWIFWFNVPLCVFAIAVGIAVIPRDQIRGGATLDLPGNAIVIAILAMITFGISQASSAGWTAPSVWLPVLVALLLLPVLLWAERRSDQPVLDPQVLSIPGVRVLYVAVFLNGAARFPVLVLMSLYFQGVLGESPLRTAVALVPLPAATILASLALGPLTKRFRGAWLSAVGSGIGLLGVGGVTCAVYLQVTWPIAPSLALVGCATGLFFGPNTTSLLDKLPAASLGVGNAVRLTLLNVGTVLALALSMSILTAAMPARLRDAVLATTITVSDLDDVIPGFEHALTFMTIVAIAGFVASALGVRDDAERASTTAPTGAAAGDQLPLPS